MSGAFSVNDKGYGVTGDNRSKSFYRVVTFNLDDMVGGSSKFTVDTHWTFSSGNDLINVNVNVLISRNDTQVPDPSVSMLFGPGFLGLFALQLVEGEKNYYKLDLIQKARFPCFFLFGYLLI